MSVYEPPAKAPSNVPAIQLDSATLNSLMFSYGWTRSSGGGWTRSTQDGPAYLMPLPSVGVYPELELRAGSSTRTTPSKHLRANAGLAGPAKFVIPRGCRRPTCRCALPALAANFVMDPDRVLDDPRQFLSWVTAVNQLVTPTSTPESSNLDFEALTAHLKSCGWNAESGPDRTMVHVQRRGLYSQVVLECHPRWVADRCQLNRFVPGVALVPPSGVANCIRGEPSPATDSVQCGRISRCDSAAV